MSVVSREDARARRGALPPGVPAFEEDAERIRAVVESHGLDLIVLFGSTARGQRQPGSDIDVAIRFAGRQGRVPFEEEARAADALFRALRPRCEMDVVSLNGAPVLLRRNVARDGRPLFASSPDAWAGFRIHARREWEEWSPFYDRHWQSVRRRLLKMSAPSAGQGLSRKLTTLAAYADELEGVLADPPAPERPRVLELLVERLFHVTVECAADAGDLWLTENAHPGGESMRGVFERLRELGVISPDLADRFVLYGRYRNRIVHDYDALDAPDLMARARSLPDDARALGLALGG